MGFARVVARGIWRRSSGACPARGAMKDILVDHDMYSVRAFCAVVLGVGRDKMATAIAIYKLTNGYGDRYIYCLVYVIVTCMRVLVLALSAALVCTSQLCVTELHAFVFASLPLKRAGSLGIPPPHLRRNSG